MVKTASSVLDVLWCQDKTLSTAPVVCGVYIRSYLLSRHIAYSVIISHLLPACNNLGLMTQLLLSHQTCILVMDVSRKLLKGASLWLMIAGELILQILVAATLWCTFKIGSTRNLIYYSQHSALDCGALWITRIMASQLRVTRIKEFILIDRTWGRFLLRAESSTEEVCACLQTTLFRSTAHLKILFKCADSKPRCHVCNAHFW